MRLRYAKADGTQMEFELGERPITIGRSPEADVVLLDDKSSRIHCGIRLWDGDFYIKDLKSKNGTYVNEQRIEVHKLSVNDRIRVGSALFSFEQETAPMAPGTVHTAEEEMVGGKGYTTLLREIADDGEPAAQEARPIRVKTRNRDVL